jgi:hypothetical protein
MSEVAEASPAPTKAAPVAAQIQTESADSPRLAERESLPDDAASKEDGEQGDARPPKTAEQRELETLRRQRARQERVNARLWAENEAMRQRGQQAASPAPADPQSEERVQVTRRDFEAAATARGQQLAQQMTAETRLAERCNSLLDVGTKMDPKFDQAVVNVGAELPLFDRGGQPTPALEEILDSPQAAKLILHLNENPDVAAELADLSPRQLTRRLIAIEAGLAKPAREVSTAPRPLEPERAAARATAAPDPGKNPEAWREWRNKTSKVR